MKEEFINHTHTKHLHLDQQNRSYRVDSPNKQQKGGRAQKLEVQGQDSQTIMASKQEFCNNQKSCAFISQQGNLIHEWVCVTAGTGHKDKNRDAFVFEKLKKSVGGDDISTSLGRTPAKALTGGHFPKRGS